MAKYYNFNGYDVRFVVDHYYDNGNLALIMLTSDGEEYGMLTVNIGVACPDFCSYVDTNNLPDAMDFIADNGLGVPTGIVNRSGFCLYPEVMFDYDFINECQEEGY